MLPCPVYYPHGLIFGSYDYLSQNMITFPYENLVLFQTPTALKTTQLLNPANVSPDNKLKNSVQKQSKFGRKITKNHQKRKNRQNSNQNEIRNIFSNIARLVINFVSLESKSKSYLLSMLQKSNPNMRQFQICQFYKQALISKKKIKTVYLSKNTFYEFLGLKINQTNSMLFVQQFQTKEESHVKKIFRSLSYYYLHSILPKQIIHSKKINPNLKQGHLKIGLDLLQTLRLMKTV